MAQLEEEYGEGLKAALEDEEEWEEDALWEAVGNREGAQEALLAWQLEEAEATR